MKIGEVELALPDYQDSDQDEVRKKLTALLGSLEGTYPMNRSYGINSEVFDYPIQTAKSLLAAEIYEKTEQYIPNINVLDVNFRADLENNILYPVISYELADVDADEEDSLEENDFESEGDEYESD